MTLHDVTISQESKDGGSDHLTLDVTAKTYRYLDDAETVPDKGKGAKGAAGAAGGAN